MAASGLLHLGSFATDEGRSVTNHGVRVEGPFPSCELCWDVYKRASGHPRVEITSCPENIGFPGRSSTSSKTTHCNVGELDATPITLSAWSADAAT